ncbi:amino acid permease-domain-containing protein [Aspergillus undulatus]|uniref:amino acid permease-domain-containing protein n=1 Tax=Aspergillus undulatus TaxID=1810928 RepID=UPI003CCDA780
MDAAKLPDETALEKTQLRLTEPIPIPPSPGLSFPPNVLTRAPPLTDNTPQLTRTLSTLGAIGLAFTITNSWMSYAATFGTALLYGGGVTVLFGLIVAAVAQWVVLLGVCEMVSAVPSSGGCYHFTYAFSTPKIRRFASFAVGMVNLLGFWIGGVSAAIYTTQSVFGMVGFALDGEGFEPGLPGDRWEVYLAYVGVVLVSLIPILTIPPHKTKYLTTASLTLSLLFLVTFITVLATLIGNRDGDSPGKESKYNTSNLTTHQNRSGWSDPTAWLLSISLGMYSFSATGTVVNLAEEVPRAGWGVPVAINTTMALGLTTAIPFIIVVLLGISDVPAVQEAYIPTLEAFYQATGRKAVAVGLQGCLVLLYYTVVCTQWVSVSRIAWSLARDVSKVKSSQVFRLKLRATYATPSPSSSHSSLLYHIISYQTTYLT